ncbi:psbP family protein [Klebsormidium nitens]|uniref:PsbP family protein n=1 Tax=Klebsormidium nitens TaxID=105231 RepID=A0A1Y1HZR7_KLENI|nr:psbP family protein [Klebsormidium nitens]|eukprot:GAQ82421.1 psbP family protein [Klebsormidium nitens]
MALSQVSAGMCNPLLHFPALTTSPFVGPTFVLYASHCSPASSTCRAITRSRPQRVYSSVAFGLTPAPLLESSLCGGTFNSRRRSSQRRLRTRLYVHNSKSAAVSAEKVGERQCSAIRVEQVVDASEHDDVSKGRRMGRRNVLELAALTILVGNAAIGASPAHAYKPPPEGFRRYTDRLDGFTLLVPDYWVQVRGSGAEVQFRSPQNGDENLFVAVSSPSSSKYTGVKDLGSPEESGKFIKKQYVAEYMSTRIGVRRTAEVVSASSREVEEGKPYYQIEMSVKSEANSNQLAVTPEERVPFVEWERRYITVQAVENKRLYELRVQIPADIYGRERALLQTVLDSFRTFPVESFEGGKPVWFNSIKRLA